LGIFFGILYSIVITQFLIFEIFSVVALDCIKEVHEHKYVLYTAFMYVCMQIYI